MKSLFKQFTEIAPFTQEQYQYLLARYRRNAAQALYETHETHERPMTMPQPHQTNERKTAKLSENILQAQLDFEMYHPSVIFKVVAGSRGYYLDQPDSDVDIRGFYVVPTLELFGVRTPPESIESTHTVRRGGVEVVTDERYWELRKFVSLLLKNNPNALELLWLDPETTGTALENENATFQKLILELVAHRDGFLTQRLAAAYGGYALNQWTEGIRLINDPSEEASRKGYKYLMHLCRLLISATHALFYGTLRVHMEGGEKKRLMELRNGHWSEHEISQWRDELERNFNAGKEHSVLPEFHSTAFTKWLNDWMTRCRLAQLDLQMNWAGRQPTNPQWNPDMTGTVTAQAQVEPLPTPQYSPYAMRERIVKNHQDQISTIVAGIVADRLMPQMGTFEFNKEYHVTVTEQEVFDMVKTDLFKLPPGVNVLPILIVEAMRLLRRWGWVVSQTKPDIFLIRPRTLDAVPIYPPAKMIIYAQPGMTTQEWDALRAWADQQDEQTREQFLKQTAALDYLDHDQIAPEPESPPTNDQPI